MKFLIPRVPDGAEYCPRSQFVRVFLNDLDRLLAGIQVVDTRLNPEDLHRLVYQPPRPELAALFEIKDMLQSPKGGDALACMSLFKMDRDESFTGKPFEVYVDGLKRWIPFYRREFPCYKLRVYVGDSAWETLYQEKILENQDVDFVRMRDSSPHTEIGTFWRFLGFDDYNYPYVYILEIDGRCVVKNGEWVCTPSRASSGRVERFRSALGEDDSIDMMSPILPSPPGETRLASITKDYPLLFWVDDYRLSDPLFLHRLTEYFQSVSPAIIRGPRRIPFSFRDIFCHHFARSDERILYHPEFHLWTNIRERHPNLNFRYIDDHWLFHLTKVIRIRHLIHSKALARLAPIFKRYGENWFFKRICDDLIADGNTFFVPKRESRGYPFAVPVEKWDEYFFC